MVTHHHTTTINRFVDRFFRNTTPHNSPLQLTNIYEVKWEILSLNPRSVPGNEGITPLVLRHLSRKTLTHFFNHLLRLGYFPICWKRAKFVPIPKPNNPGTNDVAGQRPATSSVHYTTSCNTQSSAPEDGQNNCPKLVELTGIINKPLLLHLVGCLYYLYQWCTVKHISDNEIYLLIKYIKSVLWRSAGNIVSALYHKL